MSKRFFYNRTRITTRLFRFAKLFLLWSMILFPAFAVAELYARHIGLYQRWSWPLKKIPYSARDNLKVWNKRFYEIKSDNFREWPIPVELFDADKPAPRYLFKAGLRMALDAGKLRPVKSGEKAYWSSNTLGFRGPEISATKMAGTLRIVCLGASTTEGMQSDDETYPHFLQQEVQELLPDSLVEVINAGYHGQNIDDLLEVFRQKVIPLNPDVVIFYEAANNIDWSEFGDSIAQNCWGDCWLSNYPGWYGSIWKRSALFNLLSERFGLNRRVPPSVTHRFDDSLPKSSVTHYRDALSELVCDAAKHNIRPILTSFVTIASPQLAVRAEENPYLFDEVYRRLYPMTPGEVARVYEMFNAQSAAVAREYQVHYADLAIAFPKDSRLFTIDYVHLTPDGNRLLAKLLAPHVLETYEASRVDLKSSQQKQE